MVSEQIVPSKIPGEKTIADNSDSFEDKVRQYALMALANYCMYALWGINDFPIDNVHGMVKGAFYDADPDEAYCMFLKENVDALSKFGNDYFSEIKDSIFKAVKAQIGERLRFGATYEYDDDEVVFFHANTTYHSSTRKTSHGK